MRLNSARNCEVPVDILPSDLEKENHYVGLILDKIGLIAL